MNKKMKKLFTHLFLVCFIFCIALTGTVILLDDPDSTTIPPQEKVIPPKRG